MFIHFILNKYPVQNYYEVYYLSFIDYSDIVIYNHKEGLINVFNIK